MDIAMQVHDMPRSKGQCGAKTRAGTPCERQPLQNGRCPRRGSLSTGPKTEAGKESMRRAASERMKGILDETEG